MKGWQAVCPHVCYTIRVNLLHNSVNVNIDWDAEDIPEGNSNENINLHLVKQLIDNNTTADLLYKESENLRSLQKVLELKKMSNPSLWHPRLFPPSSMARTQSHCQLQEEHTLARVPNSVLGYTAGHSVHTAGHSGPS